MAAPDPQQAYDEPPADAAEPAPDLKDSLAGSVLAARHVLADYLGLAALEAKLAGISMAAIFALMLALAFALMAAWLLLQAAAALALRRLDVPLDLSLLGMGLANLVLGWLCLRWIKRSGQNMRFKALRSALRGGGDAEAAETNY